jgi:hypothetical protein
MTLRSEVVETGNRLYTLFTCSFYFEKAAYAYPELRELAKIFNLKVSKLVEERRKS